MNILVFTVNLQTLVMFCNLLQLIIWLVKFLASDTALERTVCIKRLDITSIKVNWIKN